MPIVTITAFAGRSAKEKKALFDAVHNALRHAFKIPENDRTQRLIELPKENFEIQEGRTEKFVFVEIEAFAGRSVGAKRILYKAVADEFVALGMSDNDFMVLLKDHPLENWGIRGGQAACDVDLGFTVNV